MRLTSFCCDSHWPALCQAQFPKSAGALADGYSHCPAPASDLVAEKMKELGPVNMMAAPKSADLFQVSMWGCTADMVRTSYEVLGMGVLKFVSKGSREFTCISMQHAEEMVRTICEKEELVPPEPQQGNPRLKMLATFLHERLNKNGLSHVADLPGLVAYRAACPPGSLCYIPSGCIFSERTLNGAVTMGWRCSVVESPAAIPMLSALASDGMFASKSASALEKLVKELTQVASTQGQGRAIANAPAEGTETAEARGPAAAEPSVAPMLEQKTESVPESAPAPAMPSAPAAAAPVPAEVEAEAEVPQPAAQATQAAAAATLEMSSESPSNLVAAAVAPVAPAAAPKAKADKKVDNKRAAAEVPAADAAATKKKKGKS